MFSFLQKIRDAVSGKKTIITAVIGILTAALAWAGGELTDWQALTAVWVALQIIFIRTGNKQDVANRVDVINATAAQRFYEQGSHDGINIGYDQGYDHGLGDGSGDKYNLGFLDGYDQGDEDTRYEDE